MPQIIFEDPDGTLAMLRDSVAALASRQSGSASLRQRRAANADIDSGMWSAMAEAGWTSILLSEDLGGAGLGLAEQAALSEALGRALITEPVGAAAVVASVLLSNAPASDERTRLAEALVGGSFVAPAWQEPSVHSRGRKMQAVAKGGDVVLTGDRHFVEAASTASDFLVVAELDGAAVLLSVPAKAQGVAVEQRASVDGAQIGRVRFDNCIVPAANVLQRAASVDALMAQPVRAGRVALAAELAGIASRAVEITIGYTKDRVQFGKPIASFQVVQHRLVEMWGDAEFACSAVNNAIERQAEGGLEAELSILAAKARAGDAATSIGRRAVHLHGAMGFTDECDIGLYMKRAVALSATLGQPEALRLQFVEMEKAA